MAGAIVVPVLGVNWVGNGDLFLIFRCRLGEDRAWERGRAACMVFEGIPSPLVLRHFSLTFYW